MKRRDFLKAASVSALLIGPLGRAPLPSEAAEAEATRPLFLPVNEQEQPERPVLTLWAGDSRGPCGKIPIKSITELDAYTYLVESDDITEAIGNVIGVAVDGDDRISSHPFALQRPLWLCNGDVLKVTFNVRLS